MLRKAKKINQKFTLYSSQYIMLLFKKILHYLFFICPLHGQGVFVKIAYPRVCLTVGDFFFVPFKKPLFLSCNSKELVGVNHNFLPSPQTVLPFSLWGQTVFGKNFYFLKNLILNILRQYFSKIWDCIFLESF